MRNLLSRLFGRSQPESPPAPEDRRNMNEDWRVGDLAVCVVESSVWRKTAAIDPGKGELLRVSSVYTAVGDHGALAYHLSFVGKTAGYECIAFRKIRPESKAADTDFSEFIKRLGKSPTRVHPDHVQ